MRKPILKKIALMAAVGCLTLLLAACSSGDGAKGGSSSASSSNASAKLFNEKCQEALSSFGAPQFNKIYDLRLSVGLPFVQLIDMNGDGADELLLGYMTPSAKYQGNFDCGIQVWRNIGSQLTCDYQGPVSVHGTNGFLPYVEIVAKADGSGAAIVTRSCYGSSPELESYDAMGYKADGSFGCLGARSLAAPVDLKASQTYYVSSEGTNFVWEPNKWQIVDEADYNKAFDFLGAPIIHQHFYEFQSDNCPDVTASVEELMKRSMETVESLNK